MHMLKQTPNEKKIKQTTQAKRVVNIAVTTNNKEKKRSHFTFLISLLMPIYQTISL